MPLSARLFRVIVGLGGLGALIGVAAALPRPLPDQFSELAILVLICLAAELLLTIRFSSQRALSFSATFSFTIFVLYGAALATLIQTSAWLCSQVIRRLDERKPQSSGIFILFNAGQLALCGLIPGALIWLIEGAGLYEPPLMVFPALLGYALIYLTVNVGLTTIATWLRFGFQEVRNSLWPHVSRWTAISVGLSIPLTFFVVTLTSSIGFIAGVLLTFGFLAVLSYIVRINLRYQTTNRELTALNQISQKLTISLEMDTLFSVLYTGTRAIMPVDVFFIGFINQDGREITIPHVIDREEVLAPRTFTLEGSLSDDVMRSGKPHLINNITGPQQLLSARGGKIVATAMFVPLWVGDQAIGILSAQSYTPNAYTNHQLALLASISGIAAVAINNARLLAREKEVLRSREEFVSLVAHELKNPLAALLGHTQILERRVRMAEDKIRRPVSIIQEQGERLNRLVEDLLELSRADTGRLALHKQRVDLAALVRNVVEQHRILSTKHQLAILCDTPLPLIEGDVMRLTQVLQNLLSNAVKYSPAGGSITIELLSRLPEDPSFPPRFHRQLAAAPCWILVQVRDQGIGIPADQLGRIFERFYRATNSVQTEISGTGLGLSVCESLVRAHDGIIWADSEWGAGSTLSFALPVSPSAIDNPAPRNLSPAEAAASA